MNEGYLQDFAETLMQLLSCVVGCFQFDESFTHDA
jgi:hypothetical protein